MAALREGMSWIVPVPLLSLLTAQHLERLVCGMPEVPVHVLKKVVRSVNAMFWSSLGFGVSL